MRAFFQHQAVRRARTAFRWCRITLWLVILMVVCALAYLHLIGLPDFIKRPMLQRLFDKGIKAEFSNMQLGWEQGPSIAIENAAFSHPYQTLSPRLSANRAELALNLRALMRGQLQLQSLDVAGAELKLPVTAAKGDALVLNNVGLIMHFNSNDVLRVDRCQGTFHDIRVDFLAGVSHASEMKRWELPSASRNNAIDWQTSLRQIAQTMDKIHFDGAPFLQIEAGADGRNMNSAHMEMHFTANNASTPWGNATNLVIRAACARLMTPGVRPFLQVQFSAADLVTPWAQGRKISFSSSFSRNGNSNYVAQIQLNAPWFNRRTASAGSNWVQADGLSCDTTVTLTRSNYVPLLASVNMRAAAVQTSLGSAIKVSAEGAATPAETVPAIMDDWGPWKKFAGWALDGRVEAYQLASPKLHVKHFALSARWRAPEIAVENFRAELYDGKANGDATLDIGSRELRASGVTDFNPQSIAPLLHKSERSWLAQLGWIVSPHVKAGVRVVLPPWTNRPPNWAEDVNSSLQIGGDFNVGAASFQGVPVNSAAGHVTLTNSVWNVTHLRVKRPDGQADLDYTSNARTLEYHFVIDSSLDPKDILPLAAPSHPRLLDGFEFKQSPVVHADLAGCWRAPRQTVVFATLRATNFMVRGEPVAVFNADVKYTNLLLNVTHLFLSGDKCQARAPWGQVDFATKIARVTNASGFVDPPVLQQVLTRNPPFFLNYIHFDSPPSVSVSGSFSLTNGRATDLHFLVNSEGVRFTDFVADRASGAVDWIGDQVTVTNVFSSLYHGGTLMGWLMFDKRAKRQSDFIADFTVRDIDLSALARGLSGKTNHLEGKLDGDIGLNAPHTADKTDWHGQGHIHVHDALLWDIKLFGLLSPVLNAIAPGWGHSRAREATANFVITNGAISSDDLVVRSSGFRLNFRGSIDKDKKLKGRLEAILARDTPLVGPLLSLAFTPLSKLFEYHISGTVQDPVLEPVFVPKFILYLLHPFKSLKGSPPAGTPPAPAQKK